MFGGTPVVACMQVYVDCTLGAGGHLAAMMQQHPVSVVCADRLVVSSSHRSAPMRCHTAQHSIYHSIAKFAIAR